LWVTAPLYNCEDSTISTKPCPSAVRTSISTTTDLDLTPEVQQAVLANNSFPELLEYAVSQGAGLYVLLDKSYVKWWGVPPKDYYKHVYICAPIAEAPANCNGLQYTSIGINPYTGKVLCPADGLTERDVYNIFLVKGSAFTIKDTKRCAYSDLHSAVMQYWCLAEKNHSLKLLLNTKKATLYVIGTGGGCAIFQSFKDIREFFYGDVDPNDGESLTNLLAMYGSRLHDRLRALPNGRSIV